MRAPRGRLVSVSTALAVLLLALGPISVLRAVPAANAQSTTTISITTSNGATVCPGSLNGAWDPATDTCSITAVGPNGFSGEEWADLGEFIHAIFDQIIPDINPWPDPVDGLYIPQGTTLNVGWDVLLSVRMEAQAMYPTQAVFAIANAGTINNNGSISGASSGYGAVVNVGTINNYETGDLWFGAGNTNFGILNSGTINNDGFLQAYSDLYGIVNNGTINNEGEVQANGGSTWLEDTAYSGQGIYNEWAGTINNVGPMNGTSSWSGMSPLPDLTLPYGIYNQGGAINEYCDPTSLMLTYSSYGGAPPNPIYCSTYGWLVEGIDGALRAGADVYLTLSWGPFVLPWTDAFYLGSYNEAFIGANATGLLAYSFPFHLSCSLPDLPTRNCPQSVSLYTCQSGCSGTVTYPEGVFIVTYSLSPTPPPAGIPQFPLGLALLFALMIPALLLLRKRAALPSPRKTSGTYGDTNQGKLANNSFLG
jgi:hypothetical protein